MCWVQTSCLYSKSTCIHTSLQCAHAVLQSEWQWNHRKVLMVPVTVKTQRASSDREHLIHIVHSKSPNQHDFNNELNIQCILTLDIWFVLKLGSSHQNRSFSKAIESQAELREPELRANTYLKACKQFWNTFRHEKEIPKELLTFFLALHGMI